VKGLVVAGCAIAAVGVVQFVTGFDPASRIAVPGLSATVDGAAFVGQRSMFRRVAGTTLHPIEFSVVLCVVLPFAIHLALHASRRWFWAVALLGLALPMSVSRTAEVGMTALALVLVPSWPRSVRHRAYLGAIAYLVALRLLVPGLLGTIKSLFVDAGADPSIASRQTDYTFVNGFIAERPVFGRGLATFIPSRYDFLDNQYLMSLVETGVAGVTAFLLLVGGSAVVAALVRSRSSDPADRSLAIAVVAALAVLGATAAVFDLLSFPTVRTLLFVVVGCAGALWRLTLPVVTVPATIASVEAHTPPPVRQLHGVSIADIRSERSSS
jgi:O-antigen ligase